MTTLPAIWYRIRASLWFVPTVMAVCAIILAILALQADIALAPASEVWWLHSGGVRAAGDLLAALLSSLITMATLAISITMVVLTLAANSLGPRLIESFVRDIRTQVPLGLFLGTIVYLLLVLRTVNGVEPDGGRVPHFAVTCGTTLVLVCIATLLYLVHHLSRSIVADHVIARVGDDLEDAIATFFPAADEPIGDVDDHPLPPNFAGGAAPLRLRSGGYIQVIDQPRLVKAAFDSQATVEILFRAGDHILPGAIHGRVAPADAVKSITAAAEAAIAVGRERTPVQDPEFAIGQLTEIALRALSSGINDPSTAIAATNTLGLAFAQILQRGPAPHIWRDEMGSVRLIAPTTALSTLLEAAFKTIRGAGSTTPAVLEALIKTFAQLIELARSSEQRTILRRQIELTLSTARRTISDPHDLNSIKKLAAAALQQRF